MSYQPKGGGYRMRLVREMLKANGKPMESWRIARRLGGTDIRRVCRTLNRLHQRGDVVRSGTRKFYLWAVA